MNTKLYILLIAICTALICGSCSDFLEESNPNKITTATFYQSEEEIIQAATGAYLSLRASGYYGNIYLYTDIRSGSGRIQDITGGAGVNYQFENYTLLPDNTQVKTHWAALHKAVTRSNIVLDHLDGVAFDDGVKKEQTKAEMQFLRALAYFNLVVQFGDVPLVTSELKTVTEIEAHLKRNPKSEIYNLIKDDLTAVINSPLPDLQSTDGIGRASKVAAYALLGKVLLQKAADTDFAAERNANLTAAKAALTAAWEKKPFASLSDIPYADVFDKTKKLTCKELIFQVMYQGVSGLSSSYAYTFFPSGANGITSQRNGGGTNLATAAIVAEYDSEPADVVRRSYIGQSGAYYYTKKYVDLDDASGYGANNWIVLRYADVALLLAEVKMHLNEPDAATYLNYVRARVGLPASTNPSLRDAIAHERAVELAFEGQSWYDLLRLYSRTELLTMRQAINPNFSEKDFLLPIPYDEYKLNPEGMYQNEGY